MSYGMDTYGHLARAMIDERIRRAEHHRRVAAARRPPRDARTPRRRTVRMPRRAVRPA